MQKSNTSKQKTTIATNLNIQTSPTPKPTITPKSITKKIGNIKYTLKEIGDTDSSLLYAENDIVGFRTGLPLIMPRVRDFWYQKSSNTIYFVEGRGSSVGEDQWEDISWYSLNNNQDSFDILAFYRPHSLSQVVYSGTEIITYDENTNKLILNTWGGDSCAAGGQIWSLVGKQQTKIIQHAEGCGDVTLPAYIGYNGKLMFFGTRKQLEKGSAETMITGLFSLNPTTNARININIPDFPDKILNAKIAGDNNTITLHQTLGDLTKTLNYSISENKIYQTPNN